MVYAIINIQLNIPHFTLSYQWLFRIVPGREGHREASPCEVFVGFMANVAQEIPMENSWETLYTLWFLIDFDAKIRRFFLCISEEQSFPNIARMHWFKLRGFADDHDGMWWLIVFALCIWMERMVFSWIELEVPYQQGQSVHHKVCSRGRGMSWDGGYSRERLSAGFFQ